MIETLSHPAQSAEFLSRLHDRELSPDEASAFESHRRECEECRAAVAEYESALAAYRETDVTPHASDLSARILRKIRTASPSRRPFGVMFGIDIRWAGVLAAALLVVIIGAPVFRHRTANVQEEAAPGSRAPIPAYVLDAEEQKPAQTQANADGPARMKAAPKSEAAPAAPSAAAPAERGFAAVPPASSAESVETGRHDEIAASTTAHDRSEEKLAAQAPAPSAPSLPAAAPSSEPKERERANVATSRRQSAAAPQGGEGGGGGAEESPVSVTLSIQSADGQGEAPDVVHTPSDQRLATLQGRKFLLIVEVSGRVRAVEERTADNKLTKDKSAEADSAAAAARALEASVLRELVFQAGDRSRRILVTVSVR